MIDGEMLQQFMQESMVQDDFYVQLEAWEISPEDFSVFLNQYTEHAAAYHIEKGETMQNVVLSALVAGFEIGYRCRNALESQTDVTIPDFPDFIPEPEAA